jgi:hypothetical protein
MEEAPVLPEPGASQRSTMSFKKAVQRVEKMDSGRGVCG